MKWIVYSVSDSHFPAQKEIYGLRDLKFDVHVGLRLAYLNARAHVRTYVAYVYIYI